ncbi:MAG: alpha/beta hydrolase [Deltaproteobacteria bacterium]|nr:alpha/beta hydrolase [Deltaproteobacteria bacterium]
MAAVEYQPIGQPADLEWDRFSAPHRRYLDMGDYRVFYLDIGEGPVTVLLHGFAASMYVWSLVARNLVAAGRRVVMIDLPGMGQSSMVPTEMDMGVDRQGDRIAEILRRIGLSDVDLAGISMGGAISLHMALNHKELFRSVTVVTAAAYKVPGDLARAALKAPYLGVPVSWILGKWTARATIRRIVYDRASATEHFLGEYCRAFDKPGYRQFVRRLMREFDNPRAMAMGERYHEIDLPTMIVWGRHDPLVPPAFADRLHASIPESRLEWIEDCGHVPPREHPDHLTDLLHDFWASLKGEGKEA